MRWTVIISAPYFSHVHPCPFGRIAHHVFDVLLSTLGSGNFHIKNVECKDRRVGHRVVSAAQRRALDTTSHKGAAPAASPAFCRTRVTSSGNGKNSSCGGRNVSEKSVTGFGRAASRRPLWCCGGSQTGIQSSRSPTFIEKFSSSIRSFRRASTSRGTASCASAPSRVVFRYVDIFPGHLRISPGFFSGRLDNNPVCGDTGVFKDNIETCNITGKSPPEKTFMAPFFPSTDLRLFCRPPFHNRVRSARRRNAKSLTCPDVFFRGNSAEEDPPG